MSRARNIKPSFFTNDILAECEPLARLLFAGLWTIADRNGRLEDRPKKIKAEVLPYDDCDCESLLKQLETYKFIIRYKSGENNFIQVLNFVKHQNPHVKEAASIIPAPDKHQTSTVQNVLLPDSPILIPDSPIPHTLKREPVKKPATITEFILDDWVPVKPWEAWMEVRKKKGAAQTDYAKELALKELERLTNLGHDPTKILNQSTLNSWKDLYELKDKNNANISGNPGKNNGNATEPGPIGKSKWTSATEQIIAEDRATGRWKGGG